MMKVEKSVIINKPVSEVFSFTQSMGNYTKWQRTEYMKQIYTKEFVLTEKNKKIIKHDLESITGNRKVSVKYNQFYSTEMKGKMRD